MDLGLSETDHILDIELGIILPDRYINDLQNAVCSSVFSLLWLWPSRRCHCQPWGRFVGIIAESHIAIIPIVTASATRIDNPSTQTSSNPLWCLCWMHIPGPKQHSTLEHPVLIDNNRQDNMIEGQGQGWGYQWQWLRDRDPTITTI